ncbi:hypothetical protein [Planctomicrobium sp. SH664]|uniref:hypothetical protein n=1 Tax=Planctomicrobium sp. SH664 TaxID=3448125 RepID=UPI003F5C5502
MTLTRTWMFQLRTVLITGMGTVLLGIPSGCASRGNVEVLEAQLRSQESVIHHFEREVERLQAELATSRREIDIVRSEVALAGHAVTEETSRSLARVVGLEFNTLLTAAQDRDGSGADERLYAVVYPHDNDGEIVKLSGELEVELLDLSRSGQKTIGHWSFSTEETRRLWHAGFLISGYELDLPWEQPPSGSKVLLLARLKTPDGRSFEATHTVKVNVPGPEAPLVDAQQRSGPLSKVNVSQTRFEEIPQSRLVPDLTPAELQKADSQPVPPPRIQEARPAEHSVAPAPKPFPSRQTSDKWTDETIPQWR